MTKARVAFLGDSITHGVGDRTGLGWPGRLLQLELERSAGFTVYNLGIRSDTSAHIRARWSAECNARLPIGLPRIYVFSFGINDATERDGRVRVDLSQSLENSAAMLADAKSLGDVLWIGPTPVDETSQPSITGLGILQTKRNSITAEYSNAYAKLAGELGIPYLDLYRVLSRDSSWFEMLDDGVHPNSAGYDKIAGLVDEWLPWQSILSVSRP